ncbi:MAG: ABC transporter substrate binding protein [Acidobacteriota bacterium]
MKGFSKKVRWLALAVIWASAGGAPSSAQPAKWVELHEDRRPNWRLVSGATLAYKEVQPRIEPEGQPGRILVVFHKKSSSYDVALSRLLQSFAARKRWSTFSLVFYGGARHRLRRHLRLAERGEYQLIFAMGSGSAVELNKSYRSGKVPVVTVCAKDPVLMGLVEDYAGDPEGNIAYTSLDVPVAGQLRYLKELRPDLRQIAVVYARSNASAVQSQVEPLRIAAASEGIAVLDVAVENPETAREELEIKAEAAARALRSVDQPGEGSLFWITGSTAVFDHIDVIWRHAGGLPVLAVTPSLVDGGPDGALLSIGVSFESNAELAGVYALQILSGRARAGELGVGVVMPPDIAIDMGKARALGLKIPFRLFEAAGVIYDEEGRLVRFNGRPVPRSR